MTGEMRGRELRPRVTRRPSPALAARMKMLEADAEKRNSHLSANAAATAKLEIARSGTRTREPSVSSRSDVSAQSDSSSVLVAEEEVQIIVETDDVKPVIEAEVEIQIEDVPDVEENSGVNGGESPSIIIDCGNNNDSESTQQDDSDTAFLSTANEDAGDQSNENLTLSPTTAATEAQEAALPDKDFTQLPANDDADLEQEEYITEPIAENMVPENIQRQEKRETQALVIQPEITTSTTIMVESRPTTATSVELQRRPETASSIMTNDNDSTSCNQHETAATSPAETFDSVHSHVPLQRRASVYSLSRISFSAQLSRLTSLALPLSSEFSEGIKRMKTSDEVSDAITSSAKQILRWIETAKTVLKGLDAEDDVEWAAQGKESLSEVDFAINKFSGLMQVYVTAIEELQSRADAHDIGTKIVDIVTTMEIILDGWNEVQGLLKGVKTQVETAMEWTELWTTILQDIQAELEACQTIVFEMEEKRHRSMMEESGTGGMDIDALATIVEEPQPVYSNANEDSALLGLVARMQPLRASLDFLPMRLASFKSRAENVFPGACEDLELRRNSLEKKWKKLESDAEEMKRELGEDKWVAIFRNAGKQAIKMTESVERSLAKLGDAILEYEQGGVPQGELNKKVENYEAKKIHYGPAVLRVLAIIDKGVHERLTVNGEILRLHAAMQQRWRIIEAEISHMDEKISQLNLHAVPQLRDSLSTITSDARSPPSGVHSCGSSPASSIVLSSPAGTVVDTKAQRRSVSSAGFYKVSPAYRVANTPPSSTAGSVTRPRINTARSNASLGSNLFSPTSSRGTSPSPGFPRHSLYHTPSPPTTRRPSVTSTRSSISDNRPKWNGSVNTNDLDTGHNFTPLTLTTPSPHRKTPVTPVRNSMSLSGGKTSRIPVPSPLSYGSSTPGSSSPIPHSGSPFTKSNLPLHTIAGPNASGRRSSMLGKSPMSTFPGRRSVNLDSYGVPLRPALRAQCSMSKLSSSYRRSSVDSKTGEEEISSTSTAPIKIIRPASAMASGKRMSMLPRPRSPLLMKSDSHSSETINGPKTNGLSSSVTSSKASKRNSMPPNSPTNLLEVKPRWRS